MAIQKSPDNFLETWVGLAAIWGAITGTIALVIQSIQLFADRSKLVLQSSMGIKSDAQNPQHHLYVRLEVVNNGRRPTRIERVWVALPQSTAPLLPGMQQSADLKVSSYFTMFDAENGKGFVELSAEGGKYIFQNIFPEHLARAMCQEQETGKAFVRLTSGKELSAIFHLINPDDFPKRA